MSYRHWWILQKNHYFDIFIIFKLKKKLIAEKMGLDIKSNFSLWRDKALVELNYAILYTFQVESNLFCSDNFIFETFFSPFRSKPFMGEYETVTEIFQK